MRRQRETSGAVESARHPMNATRGRNLMRRLLDYMILPKAISAFEANYLRRINRVALAFFALHIPAMFLVAWGNSSGPWLAVGLTTAIVAGPALAYATLKNPRTVSITYV